MCVYIDRCLSAVRDVSSDMRPFHYVVSRCPPPSLSLFGFFICFFFCFCFFTRSDLLFSVSVSFLAWPGIDDEIVAGEALTPPAAIEELEKASLEKNKESGEEEEDEAARTSLHGTVNLGRVEKQGEREEEKEKEFDRQRNSAVEFLFYAEERVPRDEGPPPRAAASASAPLIDRKKQQEGQSQGEVEEGMARGRKRQEKEEIDSEPYEREM